MDIFLFSQYLAYRIGGAEESLLQLGKLKHLDKERTLHIVSYEQLSQYKVIPQDYSPSENEIISFIKAKYPIPFFPYLGYVVNKNTTIKFFENQNTGKLYASSFFAPASLLGFKGNEKYFYIQSEIDLGIPWNHEKGLRKFLKSIYNLIETPFRLLYISDLKKALKESSIICCSEYIAHKTTEIYKHQNIEIINPYINYDSLKLEFQKRKTSIPEKEKGIIFIGDAAYKGIFIAQSLVSLFPQYNFHFFSKRKNKTEKINNLSIHPWQKNIVDIYKYAHLVIMPSFCKESFGRVAREAYSLDLPVLVSNHGGLPEAVHHDENCLIDDFKNVDAWAERIKQILG